MTTHDALFNSLERGQRHVFVFGGVPALSAVFHGIGPDGTLTVADSGKTYAINPAQVMYARLEG